MDIIKQKDPRGHWILKSIFLEWNLDVVQYDPVYTIQDYDVTKDGKTYPSLYRLYMAAEDPIEFDFANEHMGCYEHWKALTELGLFKPIVERWRQELELKLVSRALKLLAAEADSGSKNAYSANKFIVEKGWIKKEAGRRGRPSKAEIQSDAEIDKTRILEVYNRLNLSPENKELN